MLGDPEYLRQRIAPRRGDPHYLHLSDLLIAVKQLVAADAPPARILDFGCGGSPYQGLFSGVYVRADIEENPDRDVTLTGKSELPLDVGSFDLVLSTQVLEHVEDPVAYLRECRRVLNKDGAVVLTTHGLFEDHPCPTDFWRWTAAGLQKLFENCGFDVASVTKITAGARAGLYMLERDLKSWTRARGVSLHKLLFALLRAQGARARHAFADQAYDDLRVTPAAHHATRYVCIGIRATPRP